MGNLDCGETDPPSRGVDQHTFAGSELGYVTQRVVGCQECDRYAGRRLTTEAFGERHNLVARGGDEAAKAPGGQCDDRLPDHQIEDTRPKGHNLAGALAAEARTRAIGAGGIIGECAECEQYIEEVQAGGFYRDLDLAGAWDAPLGRS